MKRMICILITLLLLCGCTQQGNSYDLPTPETSETAQATEVTTTARPDRYREYATYSETRPSDRVVGNKLYYNESARVSYYDIDLQRAVTLCSQPNCKHSSEACHAFLGNCDEVKYYVQGDLVYAICSSEEATKAKLFSLNTVTGERKTLVDLSPEEGKCCNTLDLTLDGNTLFYQFRNYRINEKGLIVDHHAYAYAYDLRTGAVEELLSEDIPDIEGIGLAGSEIVFSLTTEKFLFAYIEGDWKEEPIDMETYLAQGYTFDDYLAYVQTIWMETGCYSINRETGESTFLFESIYGDAHVQDAVSSFNGKKLSFMRGNMFCIYDGHTGRVTEYFEEENVGWQGLFDGRIMYNVYSKQDDGTTRYNYYWYDLTTGEKHAMETENLGSVFSVMYETMDYFYAEAGSKFISKQAYYNEDFDAAFS